MTTESKEGTRIGIIVDDGAMEWLYADVIGITRLKAAGASGEDVLQVTYRSGGYKHTRPTTKVVYDSLHHEGVPHLLPERPA